MAADPTGRALRRPTRYAGVLLFHALAAALAGGPCGGLEGDSLFPHGLLEEHVDRWVLMPSSEKSFAASSLVCLAMRTVTFTVSTEAPLAVAALCGHCTCFGRDFPVIRHDVTEIRHVVTAAHCDQCSYTKNAPMPKCAMGAI